MYDELVMRLRELSREFYLNDNDRDTETILVQASDAIEALSGKDTNVPRWIPVTERKPKTDDIVIVAIHDDSGDTPYDVTNVGFFLDVYPLGVWVVENERCNYVTHWMPLPEPPKEEK